MPRISPGRAGVRVFGLRRPGSVGRLPSKRRLFLGLGCASDIKVVGVAGVADLHQAHPEVDTEGEVGAGVDALQRVGVKRERYPKVAQQARSLTATLSMVWSSCPVTSGSNTQLARAITRQRSRSISRRSRSPRIGPHRWWPESSCKAPVAPARAEVVHLPSPYAVSRSPAGLFHRSAESFRVRDSVPGRSPCRPR